ncbi:MAG TPA: hypothetical protein VH206_16355 [Xanthobacteraceae bacterium]|jgi:hypothetical protein|nr:hypothetical protein [Xanthobacteraceae bacterium]
MRAHVKGLIAAAIFLLTTPLMAAPPAAKLAPNDIQTAFFNGQPFTASTTSNVKFKMTFSADGKMKREPASGGGAKGEGTWKLSKDGFCTTWKGSAGNCFTLVGAGENKWSVMKGSTILATWSK